MQSWEESLAAGLDMLHHYTPLQNTKDPAKNPDLSLLTNKNALTSYTNDIKETFDYRCFQQQFNELLERIIQLAVGKESKNTRKMETIQTIDVVQVKPSRSEVLEGNNQILEASKGQMHEILTVQPMRRNTGAVRRLDPLRRDDRAFSAKDDDEYDVGKSNPSNEKDLEDLSGEMHYRKSFVSHKAVTAEDEGDEGEEVSLTRAQDEMIPINEKLFSDLGIWW